VELARSTGRGQEAVQETPDGRYWSLRGYPVLDEEGEVTGLVEFGRDITEQKHRESDLHRAIREKNLLMKELNHRVKNNLAMVASLVSIKEANLDGVTDLSDLRAQVRAISFIHEKLYESDRVASISLRGYLETLLGSVFSFYSGRPVRLENRVTDVSFSVKTTAHLGLIINELATNAMKYGFPGEEEPRFSVALARRPSSDGKREGYSLTVSNSGVPFPAHIDLAEPTTLGLQLISALVDELGGMIEVEREPYPEFSIWFPEE
jgi:two-component sensor histidine kinase